MGEYRPNALRLPLDIDGGALTAANKNGVTVKQEAIYNPGQWTVTVQGGKRTTGCTLTPTRGLPRVAISPSGSSLMATARSKLSLAGITLAVGTSGVTVQNGNQGHVGELLGWVPVTIDKPKSQLPPIVVPKVEVPTVTPPLPGAAPHLARLRSPPPRRSLAWRQPSPPLRQRSPSGPSKRGSQLDASMPTGVTGVIEGDVVTLTVADGEPNQWIYAYIYTGVQVRPVGWVRPTCSQMKVDISELSDGNHKIALVGVDGTLVGWTSAAKGKITAAQLPARKDG